MVRGWVKAYRQLTEWEWYKDIKTCHLFRHLVLTANHEDNTWRGHEVKRGQKITSLTHLSFETGLSIQEVRTALAKLVSTGEITHKPTSQYSLIVVQNYELYQGNGVNGNTPNNTPVSKQVTHEQHANQHANQQQTRSKEDKNDKNDKKEYVEIVSHLNDVTGKNYKSTTKKTQSLINARINEGFTVDDFKKVIDTMYTHWHEDVTMKNYLRPVTLFGTKFESYLNTEPIEEVDINELF